MSRRTLKILAVLFFAMLAFAACAQLDLSIKNDCPGVVFLVTDGKGNILDPHLVPGERTFIGLKGTAGVSNNIVVNVDAIRMSDGVSLGSANRSFFVGNSGPMGENQEYWNISSFYPGGQCPVIPIQ